MHSNRITELQAMMSQDGVDATLYATSGNMQYFLGDGTYYWHRLSETNWGLEPDEKTREAHALNKPDCILYIPVDDEPILFSTYNSLNEIGHLEIKQISSFFAMIGDKIKPFIKNKKCIAVGESCFKALTVMVHNIDNTITIKDGERYGERLRVIKDADEIMKLRRVAEFTDLAMLKVAKSLKPGITPTEIKNHIAAIGLISGVQSLSFNPAAICVESGRPGSMELFDFPEDKPINEGTAIGFDFGYIIDGYCSDFGRSFYVGRNRQAREVYQALQDAQLNLLNLIKPGKPLNTTFDILHKKLEMRALGKYLRRADGDALIMGHQIGIDVHERPWLRSDVKGVFEPGMVVCIEPKIMWPGLCYLRCEDMVLVTETGNEPLTTFDRKLFEL